MALDRLNLLTLEKVANFGYKLNFHQPFRLLKGGGGVEAKKRKINKI
jgi:hypothetical protein